jgi:hypothetical protein
VINLLELLSGPGRYILGLDPHPAPTSPPNPASRGNAASSGESVGTSERVTTDRSGHHGEAKDSGSRPPDRSENTD